MISERWLKTMARNSSWQLRKESRSFPIHERERISPEEALRSLNFSATCLWKESSSASMLVGSWWWVESAWSRREVSNDLPNDPLKASCWHSQWRCQVQTVLTEKVRLVLFR